MKLVVEAMVKLAEVIPSGHAVSRALITNSLDVLRPYKIKLGNSTVYFASNFDEGKTDLRITPIKRFAHDMQQAARKML